MCVVTPCKPEMESSCSPTVGVVLCPGDARNYATQTMLRGARHPEGAENTWDTYWERQQPIIQQLLHRRAAFRRHRRIVVIPRPRVSANTPVSIAIPSQPSTVPPRDEAVDARRSISSVPVPPRSPRRRLWR